MCRALNSGHLQQLYVNEGLCLSLPDGCSYPSSVHCATHSPFNIQNNPSILCPTCLSCSILKYITIQKRGTLMMPFHLDLNVALLLKWRKKTGKCFFPAIAIMMIDNTAFMVHSNLPEMCVCMNLICQHRRLR